MAASVPSKPAIAQGWIRASLFCIFFFTACFVVGGPGGMLAAMSPGADDAVQATTGFGDFPWIRVLAEVAIGLLFVFIFRKGIDRQSITSLGFNGDGSVPEALAGFFLAPALLGMGALILLLSKHLQWTDLSFDGASLFISFGLMAMVAVCEELVFRGYILNNLMQSWNKWIALGVSALLFTVYHLQAESMGFFPVASIFLIGVLTGLNYLYTKNLWFAILFHIGWNFVQGPLLGFKVGGLALPSLLQTELKGDLTLTGGTVGFEGSVFGTALLIAAVLCMYLVCERNQQGVQPLQPA